jgi:hypothetical protein
MELAASMMACLGLCVEVYSLEFGILVLWGSRPLCIRVQNSIKEAETHTKGRFMAQGPRPGLISNLRGKPKLTFA